MKIKILKSTPYRRKVEREIKVGEIHEVIRVRPKMGSIQSKAYFFVVDDKERMVLDSDCKVIE